MPKNLVLALSVIFCLPSLYAQSGNAPAKPPAAMKPSVLLDLPEGSRPLEVRAAFHLSEIDEIDDEAETFEFSGVLTLVWRDARQGFDPAKEGVKEKFFHGDFQFNELSPGWYPQIVLTNALGAPESQGVILRVQPDGTSTLIQTISAVTRARYNLRRYPFDRQKMEAVFEVLGFSAQEVTLKPEPAPSDAGLARINVSQWDLRGMTISSRDLAAPYVGAHGVSSAFVVSLDMERQPLFMLRLVLGPLLLIAMLSWSVFWMDRSSLGDRMSISFVGLLTAVAYQMAVSDVMPHIAYMTLTNGILSLTFVAIAASIVVNLIAGHFDQHGQHARSNRIDHLCRRIFPLAYLFVIGVITAVTFFFF